MTAATILDSNREGWQENGQNGQQDSGTETIVAFASVVVG